MQNHERRASRPKTLFLTAAFTLVLAAPLNAPAPIALAATAPLASSLAEPSAAGNATAKVETAKAKMRYLEEGRAGMLSAKDAGGASGLTASHRYLPLGTLVIVTDKASGKTATVTVSQRGPAVAERMMDVSPAAAAALAMSPNATAMVRIESTLATAQQPAASPEDALEGTFYIQLGAFTNEANAKALYDYLNSKRYAARLMHVTSGEDKVAKVQVGPFPTLAKARDTLAILVNEHPGAFISADTLLPKQ